ncbi:DUF3857 domain-containing protein [Psychroserpens sp. XS_ASV72]|uniref:DUF3857 domain-containing protein n=1 Tax=Psychroserpens sp. XS_ASV72 TaxID=3241293 RepID=UPI0035146307
MKKILCIIILLVSQISISQNYRFGKVSEEEIQEKTHPEYPEASAAILYKNIKVSFDYQQSRGFVQNKDVHERIKIYTKEGFDYATRIFNLYQGERSSDSEEVLSLKAYTYNLEGGKIVKEKLDKDGIFEEETSRYNKRYKFTMPNVKEGCVIEFEYTIQSVFSAIDDVEIQQMIPIKRMELKIITPEYYKYSRVLNPKASYVPPFQEIKGRDQIRYQTKSSGRSNSNMTQFTTESIDLETNIISADLDNIPPLKNESYVDNLRNYQAKIIMELVQIDFPGEQLKNLSTSWEKVTKTIYNSQEFGEQLRKDRYYKDDIDALLSSAQTNDPIQKAGLVYNFVKSKVKWNDYYGYFTDQGVTKAYKEGVGNIGDINLMLTSMLRYVGLDANPVLISTKNNGIPLVPTRNGFNYVVSAVSFDGGIVLLDASRKFCTANIMPVNTLNWMGRMIREDGSSGWINLVPSMSSKESVSLNVKLNEDLSASGKARHQYTNYQAKNIRNRFNNMGDDQIAESIASGNGEIEISELEVEHLYDLNEPVNESYSYVLDNAMEDIGGNLYVKPMLFLTSEENPFKADTRVYPIDFVYPISDSYRINVMLPEGYAIESLPESIKYQFNGTDGEFTYFAKANGNFIQFIISFDLNKTLILPEEYEQFKEFFQLMIEKQNEQVVLKKV